MRGLTVPSRVHGVKYRQYIYFGIVNIRVLGILNTAVCLNFI